MPTPLVDISPLRVILASMGEPWTQRAIRPPTSLRSKGKAHMVSSSHSPHDRRTMLMYMLMLRMLEMFIMMLVLIILSIMCVMMLLLLLIP
jgi:hypothetical protein